MTYHSLRAIGDSTADQIDKCIDTGTKGDLDSKRGREKAFKDTAKCSANAYCASYGIPPESEICSTIAGEVAQVAIDIWNGIFGNQDEWDAYNQRLAAGAYLRAQRGATNELSQYMRRSLHIASTRLAEMWETADPSMRGKLGVWVQTVPSDHEDYRSFKRILDPISPSVVYALLTTNGVPLKVHTPPGGKPTYMPLYDPMLDCPTQGSLEATGKCLYDWTKARGAPWLDTLKRATPKVAAIIVNAATKSQISTAATKKQEWAKTEKANRYIDARAWGLARQTMPGDSMYLAALDRGRRNTRLLNLGLALGGTVAVGVAWYFSRKRSS